MEVSESRLAVAIISVFSLGIMLSILNGEYIQATGMSMPLFTYGVTVVAMGVGALIVILFQWRVSHKQMQSLMRILPEDERKIIDVLIREKRIEQMYLVAETGLSKVKVSRLLFKLDQRGIIEKKPLGNTNLIKLTL